MELAAGDEEDVFAGAFADVAVVVEHDGFVVASEGGLGLGEDAVDVDAGDFEAGGDAGVVDATPRGDAAAEGVGAEVVAEGDAHEAEIVGQFLELEVGDFFLAFVGEGADVDVFGEAGAFDHLDGETAEFVGVVGDVHHEHTAAAEETLVVLAEAEDVDDALFLVPVATDALENAGAVVEGVGHNADLRLFQRNELALEEGIRRAHL